MKSFSITRLKRSCCALCKGTPQYLKWKASRLRDWNLKFTCRINAPLPAWNEKLLDYEIETQWNKDYLRIHPILEMKSFSITRLKLIYIILLWYMDILTWNEKLLDYEIETWTDWGSWIPMCHLKWKASRLRDWNLWVGDHRVRVSVHLKWKASRLRDWNSPWWDREHRQHPLEMKSFSITRLKRSGVMPTVRSCVFLKWKASRLRDWNDLKGMHCGSRVDMPWNEKLLDYEIETQRCFVLLRNKQLPWNEKLLDYEIETVIRLKQTDFN